MKIEDVLLRTEARDDDRAGDQPGAAGAAAGRPDGVSQRLAAGRSRARPKQIFTKPDQQLTYDYVTGDFG